MDPNAFLTLVISVTRRATKRMSGSASDTVTLVNAVFPSGYYLRQLFKFLNTACTDIHLVFTPKGISCKRQGMHKSILAVVQMHAGLLRSYEYNSDEDRVVFSTDVHNIFNPLRNHRKGNNSVRFTIVKVGAHKVLRIYQNSDGEGDPKCSQIQAKDKDDEDEDIDLPPMPRDVAAPICSVDGKRFKEICSSSSHSNIPVQMRVYPRGLLIASSAPNTATSTIPIGDLPSGEEEAVLNSLSNYEADDQAEPHPDLYTAITCPQTHFKAFTSLSNLGRESLVRFYAQEDCRLLCMKTNISTFGELTIYLKP